MDCQLLVRRAHRLMQTHFNVNFFSLVSMLQLSIPALRESKGKVIFTSSGAAVGNYAAWGAYNASK